MYNVDGMDSFQIVTKLVLLQICVNVMEFLAAGFCDGENYPFSFCLLVIFVFIVHNLFLLKLVSLSWIPFSLHFVQQIKAHWATVLFVEPLFETAVVEHVVAPGHHGLRHLLITDGTHVVVQGYLVGGGILQAVDLPKCGQSLA